MYGRPWTILVAVIVGTAVVAAATTLSITGRGLGAGSVAVTACDSTGISYLYSIDLSEHITSVQVTSIDAACAGGILRLTLANGSSSVGSGSATLPSSGFTGTATIAVSPTPPAANVTAARAVIEGP